MCFSTTAWVRLAISTNAEFTSIPTTRPPDQRGRDQVVSETTSNLKNPLSVFKFYRIYKWSKPSVISSPQIAVLLNNSKIGMKAGLVREDVMSAARVHQVPTK